MEHPKKTKMLNLRIWITNFSIIKKSDAVKTFLLTQLMMVAAIPLVGKSKVWHIASVLFYVQSKEGEKE